MRCAISQGTRGGTDLDVLLAALEPRLRDEEFVYVVRPAGMPTPREARAVVTEDEGVGVVLPRDAADARGLAYDYVAAWITLTVHSALEAVGLTAAVSRRLADEGISCNVIAGLHHDHLLVPYAERARALAALVSLEGSSRRPRTRHRWWPRRAPRWASRRACGAGWRWRLRRAPSR